MRVVYTQQAIISLEEALDFLAPQVNIEKLVAIRDQLLDRADELADNP